MAAVRAVKRSSSVVMERKMRPNEFRYMDALLLGAASSISQNSSGRLNLLMLCAVARKMSASERLLLIQLLVQSFVESTHYVPPDAKRILEASELPPVLERVVERVRVNRQTWLAWTDNRRTWFVVAKKAADTDQDGDAAAIRIRFYDEDGECVATGTWAFDSHGKWRLDSVRAIDVPVVDTADAQ